MAQRSRLMESSGCSSRSKRDTNWNGHFWLEMSRKPSSRLGTCDAGNYVLYTGWGGYIINAKSHKHIDFDRVKNTYAIDAFVRATAKGFPRQAVAP